jgi:hypothetical protein
VKSITPCRITSAYVFCAAPWSLRLGRPVSDTVALENTMSSFDSYRDLLREHARGHHLVASAWLVLVVLAVLVAIFA